MYYKPLCSTVSFKQQVEHEKHMLSEVKNDGQDASEIKLQKIKKVQIYTYPMHATNNHSFY